MAAPAPVSVVIHCADRFTEATSFSIFFVSFVEVAMVAGEGGEDGDCEFCCGACFRGRPRPRFLFVCCDAAPTDSCVESLLLVAVDDDNDDDNDDEEKENSLVEAMGSSSTVDIQGCSGRMLTKLSSDSQVLYLSG